MMIIDNSLDSCSIPYYKETASTLESLDDCLKFLKTNPLLFQALLILFDILLYANNDMWNTQIDINLLM